MTVFGEDSPIPKAGTYEHLYLITMRENVRVVEEKVYEYETGSIVVKYDDAIERAMHSFRNWLLTGEEAILGFRVRLLR